MNKNKRTIASLFGAALLMMGCGSGETIPTGAGGSGGGGGGAGGGVTEGATTASVSASTGAGGGTDVLIGHGCDLGKNGMDRRTPVAPFWNDSFGPGMGALNEVGALAALRIPAPGPGKWSATAYTYYVSEPLPGPGFDKYCGRVDHDVLFYVVKKTGTPNPHPTVVRTAHVKQAELSWDPDPIYEGWTAEVTVAIEPPLEYGEDEAVIAAPVYAVADSENRLCPMACHDGPDPDTLFSKYDPVTFKVAPCPDEACDLIPMEVAPDAMTAMDNGSFDDRWIGTLTVHQIE